jgi:predicted Zn finger-like uncharacterized protein
MITVICEKCGSRHQVAGAALPATGKPFKCPNCKHTFMARPEAKREPELDDLSALAEPLGSDDEPDLLAPKAGKFEIADLPTPKKSSREIVDLPAPRAPREIIDLPAPKRGADLPDLLAPVGPTSKRGLDLPVPVGPVPTKGGIDLPTPVGPYPSRGAGLPAPVGPVPTKGIGLPAPVGPVPTKGIDLPAPVGPVPTQGIDLPAPKGFFDDLPQSKVSPRAAMPSAGVPSLDDLDLVPAGGPPEMGMPALELDSPLPPPQGSSFQMGALDLDGGNDGGVSPELSLPPMGEPPPEEDMGGVVSFGKPSMAQTAEVVDRPPPRPSSDEELDVAEGPRRGTLSDGSAVARATDLGRAAKLQKEKVERTPQQARRRKILVSSIVGGLVLVGVAGFAFVRMQAQQQQERTIAKSLLEGREFMASDDPTHWDAAVKACDKALALDKKQADALGLKAQALLASVIDDGRNEKKRTDQADDVLSDAARAGVHGAEIEKGTALRAVMDGKADEARKALAALSQKDRADKNLPLYQGWAELEGQNPAAAKDYFGRALQLAPNRVPALYGLGLAHLAAGPAEYGQAKAKFLEVLKTRSSHIGARVGLVEMDKHDRAGKREKSIAEIIHSKEAEQGHPRQVSRAWSLYADEALAFGRIDEAADRYAEAFRLDRRNIDAEIGKAVTAMEQGKLPEARSRVEGVLKQQPSNVKALVAAARLSLLESKVSEAHDYIDRAVKAKADHPEVQLWLGHVLQVDPVGAGVAGAEEAYKKAISLDPERFEPYIALSRLLLAQGRNPEGVKVLEPVEKAAAGDAILANTLGVAYLGAGDAQKAETWFKSATQTDPKNVDARANLGNALEAQGNLPAAIVELEAAHRMAIQREDVILRLAVAYEKAKRVDDGERLYGELLKPRDGSKPPSLAARAAAGRFYARRGSTAQAATLGESILAEDPRYPAGLFLRGVALLAEDKASDAQKHFQDAIALDPQPQYYDGLGRAHEKQRVLEDAVNAYDIAIKRDPSYVAPRVGKARVYMSRRDFKGAMPDLQEAVRLEPENPEIHARIGECLKELKKNKEAVEWLQKAIALDGRYARAYFLLGDVLYDDNKADAAAANLKRFIDLSTPDDPARPYAYYVLGRTHAQLRNKAAMCQTFKEFMEVAEKTDPRRDEVKRYLLPCP